MRQDLIGKTISWSVGFALPVLLLVMGALSILLQESSVPMSKGFGRFGFGATEASGPRAIAMGVAYVGFAAFLAGSAFHPLRHAHERLSIGLQIAGFACTFVFFGYVLLFSRG